MRNDRMNNTGETILSWAKKIGLAPMLTFEEILQDSYIYEGKAHWHSDARSRKKLSNKLGNVSDTRVKQNIMTLVKNELLIRKSRGIYIINERAANIMTEHPTKSGR